MLLSQEQLANINKILATPCTLRPPDPFSAPSALVPALTVLKWLAWKRRFLRYLRVLRFRSVTLTDSEKIDLLMFLMGEQREELYIQLCRMGLSERDNFWKVLKQVEAHFKMIGNVIYRRFHFNNREQLLGESAHEYVTTVKSLADQCEYGHLRDEMVRDRLIVGIISENARQDMLDNCEHLSLEQAVWIVHCDELKGRRRPGF